MPGQSGLHDVLVEDAQVGTTYLLPHETRRGTLRNTELVRLPDADKPEGRYKLEFLTLGGLVERIYPGNDVLKKPVYLDVMGGRRKRRRSGKRKTRRTRGKKRKTRRTRGKKPRGRRTRRR